MPETVEHEGEKLVQLDRHTDYWFDNANPSAIAHFFENRTELKNVIVFKCETRSNQWFTVHGYVMINGYRRKDFSGTTSARNPEQAIETLNNKINKAIKEVPQWNY